MQQYGSKYFAHIPLPGQFVCVWGGGGGSKGQNLTFLEYGHCAYQIKGNDACSNMKAHILSLHTPSTPGMGSKVKTIFFSESSHVAYQFNGNGAYSTMQTHILSLHTPSIPRVVGSKHFLNESSHFAYQIKGDSA